jgi:hypothetical protein
VGVSAYIEYFAAERRIEALEQLLYRGTTQIAACLIKVLPAPSRPQAMTALLQAMQ